MHYAQKKTRGFTLIELSIVLVIIGLIVGGVLVGQDLIKAAEVRAQISQLEKYNTAVSTFKTKYNGIPGDIDPVSAGNFGFTVGTGCDGHAAGDRNGDGLIDATSYYPYYQGLGETELFWSDLSSAGFLDAQLPTANAPAILCDNANNATTISSTQIGVYLPVAKLGLGNYIYVFENNGANWFGIAAVNALGNNWVSVFAANRTIPVTQAYNIDKKIDDGLPTTGLVQAAITWNPVYWGAFGGGNPDTASTCYNSSTNTYSTNINSGNNPNCALSLKMQGAAR